MIGKKSEERQIVWWNLITLLLMTVLSFVLINSEVGPLFYGIVAALFLCLGIFIKRTYVFLGILILVLVLVFVVKDGFFGTSADENSGSFNFNFFINSNK
ncbi:hypothetical protein IKO70_01945 [bacterium]|jgi:uncharacterized Tic20 family protein|nr:hypothetical protein [bacterium]